jgi:hypothetical protein
MLSSQLRFNRTGVVWETTRALKLGGRDYELKAGNTSVPHFRNVWPDELGGRPFGAPGKFFEVGSVRYPWHRPPPLSLSLQLAWCTQPGRASPNTSLSLPPGRTSAPAFRHLPAADAAAAWPPIGVSAGVDAAAEGRRVAGVGSAGRARRGACVRAQDGQGVE